MPRQTKPPRVLVVGAGPVGMVCALALNRAGIAVAVCEQEPAPVKDQRAASIHPPTLELLDALGVTQKIIPRGLVSPTYRYHDRMTNSVVAEFDLARMRDEFPFPFVLQYEQYKLTASITAEYADAGDFDVRFSHYVTGLTQQADGVTVDVTSPGGAERLEASYVIGCDGGRSTVRKFAGIEFEGFTYPEKFPRASILPPSVPRSSTAIISPIRTNGAICSRCVAKARAACGGRSFPSATTRTRQRRCRASASRRGCRNSSPRPAATKSHTSTSIRCTNAWRRPCAYLHRFKPLESIY